MKYLGCAYYPEYWGPERVAEDMRLMRQAGINLVRLGEFAWARMEPRDGEFTLHWLHECVQAMQAADISVVLCTPTAAPPAWLTSGHPETLLLRGNGQRAVHGGRRHYCYITPTYLAYCERIAGRLASEFAHYPHVAGWQIDNELGPEGGPCHCEHCQQDFRRWLEARYGTLEALNRAWGTGFWGTDYSDWNQVRLSWDPVHSPSLRLDSRRHFSDALLRFARVQAQAIRRFMPAALITTNSPGSCPVNTALDNAALYQDMDVAANDLYFDIGPMNNCVGAMDYFRALKPGRPYWVTETGAGALDWGKPPHPDQFRAWAWSGFAHGAEAWIVFRWRTCLSGREQELQGMLEHSGAPGHRFRAVQSCFREMEELRGELAALPLPVSQVAIIFDAQSQWALDTSFVGGAVDYMTQINRLHEECWGRNVSVDIIAPERPLDDYRLVLLPSAVIIAPTFAKHLLDFLQRGGVVLAFGQIGMRDRNNKYLDSAGPDHLQDLFGLRLVGGMYLRSHMGPDEGLFTDKKETRLEIPLEGEIGGEPHCGSARTWIGDVQAAGCHMLLCAASDDYRGQPVAAEMRHGEEGLALYLAATDPDEATLRRLMAHSLDAARVSIGPETPRRVEVVQRGNCTFAINHTDSPVTFTLPGQFRTLLGPEPTLQINLSAYGIWVGLADLEI